MRTAGKQKAGFYPTPLEVVELIADHVDFYAGGNYRFLDPCCGEGEALRLFASRLGLSETYGIELEEERAKLAGNVLKKVLSGSFESMRSVWHAFSVLFLNPPYDFDEETKRLEHKFLVKLTPYLQNGGLLVYIITKKNLIRETARYLASHYENVRVMRFPDPHYERFNQIVILATRRDCASLHSETEKKLLAVPTLPDDSLIVLKKTEQSSYRLVEAAPNFAFYSEDINPAQEVNEIHASGLLTEGRVRDVLFPESLPSLKPLMPLRKGHLAMLISAGYLNNTLLEYRGQQLLIKGRCVKEQVKVEIEDDNAKTIIERDVIKTTIKGLSLNTGEIITIS